MFFKLSLTTAVQFFSPLVISSLRLLLRRNVMPGEVTQSGMTELHVACQVGRPHNVEVLLNHAFKGTVNHLARA